MGEEKLENEICIEKIIDSVKEGWIDKIEKNRDNWFYEKINVRNQGEFSIFDCIQKRTTPEKDSDIFNALKLFKPEKTKVLIIGQDPYPEVAKAHGYSFSVPQSYTEKNGIDASLANIFKAITKYNKKKCTETDLSVWALNGILLLNTALTFEKSNAYTEEEKLKEQSKLLSKHVQVWRPFFQKILHTLLFSGEEKLAIFLWGKKAQKAFLQFLNKN